MHNQTRNWIDWWKKENIVHEVNWRKNMELFIRATDPLLQYAPHDHILDIGCGPGYLADALKHRVRSIHCLDINESYVAIGQKKFVEHPHVFFHKLDENDYTNLSSFYDKKFSIIVCLSIIQYYRHKDEVEKLIEEVRKVALPGAKFLIADILTNERLAAQILGLIKTGWREKYLLESFKLLYRNVVSDYRQYHSSIGLLSYSTEELQRLIDRLQLNATILNTPMTTNANRRHLLIQF